MPQNAFFPQTRDLLVSWKTMQWHFFSTFHPLSPVIFATATVVAYVLLRNSKCSFSTNSGSSGQPKNYAKTLFFHPPSPFPSYLQLQQWWHMYCFAVLGSTSSVIHSVKQRLLRNWPGSDAATSCNFFHERLERAFTHANQLHWNTQ